MTLRGRRDGAAGDSGGFGESDVPRDDRLRAALRYAPDADVGVPPQVAARIVAAAHRAAHERDAIGRLPPAPIDRAFRCLRAWFAASAWRLGGAGTVAAVMLVASVLWVGREELLTDESAPAAARVAAPDPASRSSLADRPSMPAAVPTPALSQAPPPSPSPASDSGDAARDRAASKVQREPGPLPVPPTRPMPALAAGQMRIEAAPAPAAALAPATEPRQSATIAADRTGPEGETGKRVEAEAASESALRRSSSAETTVRGLRSAEAPRADASASMLARPAPFAPPPWRAPAGSRLTWREPAGGVVMDFPPSWLDALGASIDRTSSSPQGRSFGQRAGNADGPNSAVREVVVIDASGRPAGVLHLGQDAVSWCPSASAPSAAATAFPSCERAAADPMALARLKSALSR